MIGGQVPSFPKSVIQLLIIAIKSAQIGNYRLCSVSREFSNIIIATLHSASNREVVLQSAE